MNKLSWPTNLDLPEPFRKNFTFVLSVTTCVIGAVIIGKFTKSSRRNCKIKDKQESCKEALEKLAEHLEENGVTLTERNAILELSFEQLRQKLQTGELKCVDVLHAYQSQALQVNGQLNCLVEPIWEAEALALERDMNTGRKGPLHGIPVSIKENYFIEGYDCTGGMSSYLDKPAKEDAVIVKVLKKQGAIPFVRTNIPQTMMTYECANPIYGVTKNPHDHTRVPGGSSGGEGSLIGASGSLLGFGSDIGGSIRIPSHMCGVNGIKPTNGRLSYQNMLPFQKGQKIIKAAPGPLAADVNALVVSLKSILVPELFERDPTVVPLPFRNEIFESKRPLRIGYFLDNGYITPVPACQRAVTMATEVLEANGHTLVEFEPPSTQEMFELFLSCVFGDSGKSYIRALKNDVIDPTIRLPVLTLTWPRWWRNFSGWIVSLLARDSMMNISARAMAGARSVLDFWDVGEKVDAYKKNMLKKWKASKIDVLICPGFAFPAPRHGKVFNVLGGVTYTTLFNLLDYPAGSQPVTKVTAKDEADMVNYPAKTFYEKCIKKESVGSRGLPVNVQCAALPYQEELVLRVMTEIEAGLKNS